jgi:hypothetical protein
MPLIVLLFDFLKLYSAEQARRLTGVLTIEARGIADSFHTIHHICICGSLSSPLKVRSTETSACRCPQAAGIGPG